ncbi:MAG: nucleotidyltransferase domain-containing protein [Promethearchaeota archaeon]
MKKINIAQFLTNHALSSFPDSIAIIAVYGSVALGTENEFSDIDMFAIVENKSDTDLPWEFVLPKFTIDFWKMTWEDAERMALGKVESAPWAVSASLIANCKVLYARSESTKAQFASLREKTKRSDEENIKQITDLFSRSFSAIEYMQLAKLQNDLVSARWGAWAVINNSVKFLSLLNNAFLTKNWGSNLLEVFKLPLLPDNYQEQVRTLSTSSDIDEMMITGRVLLLNLRKLIVQKQRSLSYSKPQMSEFCKEYTGLRAYIDKVRSACRQKDILGASYAANELQIWIAEELAKVEEKMVINLYQYFNLYEEVKRVYEQFELPDLDKYITSEDFKELERAVNQLEAHLQRYCQDQNVRLKIFQDFKSLEQYFEEK